MGRKAETTLTLRVKLNVPPGANTQDVLAYVRDAVPNLSGALSPDDPMFDLDKDSVKVSLLKKEVNYA